MKNHEFMILMRTKKWGVLQGLSKILYLQRQDRNSVDKKLKEENIRHETQA
jgi:hypothetical protein